MYLVASMIGWEDCLLNDQ